MTISVNYSIVIIIQLPMVFGNEIASQDGLRSKCNIILINTAYLLLNTEIEKTAFTFDGWDIAYVVSHQQYCSGIYETLIRI